MELKLSIDEIPVAQGRPRFCMRSKHPHVYDPHKKIKDVFKAKFRSQFHEEPIEGPIEVDVTFYIPIAKSTPKYKKALMLANDIKHVKKGDIDNNLKFLFDSMNLIIFHDDSQIWHLNAKKLYSDNPRVEITLNY